MMRKYLIAIAVAAAAISPAHAGVVFSDNFDGENGGNSFLNYTGYANFASTGAGFTDVVKSGDFGIVCSGSCVDLDGSPGPGELTSLASFSFNAGDVIRLSFDLGGSQRIANGSDGYFAGFTFGSMVTMINYGFNFFGSDVIVFPNTTTTGVTTSTSINSTDPFATRSIFFTAGNAGTLTFRLGSNSADNIGPLLDNVLLDITAVPEPSTWAMMIFGFGLTGAAMRRSRRKIAAPALA